LDLASSIFKGKKRSGSSSFVTFDHLWMPCSWWPSKWSWQDSYHVTS
jgi:hypothetical protein